MNNALSDRVSTYIFLYSGFILSIGNILIVSRYFGLELRGEIQYLLSLQMLLGPISAMGLGLTYCYAFKEKKFFPGHIGAIIAISSISFIISLLFINVSLSDIKINSLFFVFYIVASSVGFYLIDISRVDIGLRTYRVLALVPNITSSLGIIIALLVNEMQEYIVIYSVILSPFVQCVCGILLKPKNNNIYSKKGKRDNEFIKYTAQQLVNIVSMAIFSSIDKLYMALYLTKKELGLYSVYLGMASLVSKLFEITSSIYASELYNKNGDVKFGSISNYVWVSFLFFLCIPSGYILGEYVLPLAINEKSEASGQIMIFILITAIINGVNGIISQKIVISKFSILISVRTFIAIIFFIVSIWMIGDISFLMLSVLVMVSSLLRLILSCYFIKILE